MDFGIIQDTQTETLERPIVPAGLRTMSIVAAEEGPNDYKTSDENPEGICLKLRLTDASGGFRFVFDDIPRHLGWRAKQLAESLGIEPAGGRLQIDPAAIVGRDLLVEISHYTSKAGKVSAVVKRYSLPDPKRLPKSAMAAAAPKAMRQTAAQRITAALPDDEIPFLWLLPFLMFFGA